MRQNGRQPGAAGTAPERPEPPRWLDEREAEVWQETVDACAPDWFPPETHQILAMYCGHVVRYRYYSAELKKLITEANEIDEETQKPKGLDTLLAKDMQTFAVKESAAAATLATRMRITQQSQYDKSKRREGSLGRDALWEK